MLAVSGLLAVAVSLALATAGAALWKRTRGSRDVVFADLLLWGWVRRCWTELRLAQATELYDSAMRAGPAVRIELLTGLGRLLEARDTYTHGHGRRVARHAERIAREMHLPPREIAKVRAAAAVHDLGKLYTPREVLNNPGRLSEAEFEVVKRHAGDGADMLAGVGDAEIAAMVRHHHERIDGKGYPDRLAGSEIPLGARIIAVADTFDAITSNRAYRGAATQKKALEVLVKGSGTQLDSVAVAAFRRRYCGRRSVAWLAVATALSQRIVALAQTASGTLGRSGGIASILPALGAAGVLSLSPGLHPGIAHRAHVQRRPVLAGAHRLNVAAPPGAREHRRGARHAGGAKPGAPGARRRPSVAHSSPVKPLPNGPAASPAPSPSTGPGHESGAGAGGHGPPSSPGPAQTPPPVNVPPVNAPPVNVPPVNVPPVNVPPVHVPPVSVPPVNLPPVSVPPVAVPLPPGVPTGEVRAPSVSLPAVPVPQIGVP
jgi:hypothetical protein